MELVRYGVNNIAEVDKVLNGTEKAFSALEEALQKYDITGIHGVEVIRNSFWILDDRYYEARVVRFLGEEKVDRLKFRHLISKDLSVV